MKKGKTKERIHKKKALQAKLGVIVAAGVLFTGCAEKEQETASVKETTVTKTETERKETTIEGESVSKEASVSVDIVVAEPQENEAYLQNQKRREKYIEVLKNAVENHTFPEEMGVGFDETYMDEQKTDNVQQNTYAIYDVDRDGKDELIIEINNASEATKMGGIYEYDIEKDSIHVELEGTPLLYFYDTGYIREDASHSQGLCGNKMWPYSLYKYRVETDTYELVANVDAWEKEMYPKDFDGNAFPEEADASNTGILYYISYPDATEDMEACDDSAYQVFLQFHQGNEENNRFLQMTAMDNLTDAATAIPYNETMDAINAEIEQGNEPLSYAIDGYTLQELGDYYQVETVISRPVTIDANLEVGASTTVTINELAQTSLTLTKESEDLLLDADGVEYHIYSEQNKDGTCKIWVDSDDLVYSEFCRGTIRIAKDAEIGQEIINQYETVSLDALYQTETWYNQVTFENGVATKLVFVGD